MRIRIRTSEGTSTLTLPASATVADLAAEISSTTSIPSFTLKHSYPPTPLDLDSFAADLPLSSTGVPFDGSQLHVTPRDLVAPLTSPIPPPYSSSSQREPERARDLEEERGYATVERRPRSSPTKSPSKDPPRIYIPSQQLSLVLRVMPDDNSCLFRAVAYAVQSDSGPDGVTALRYNVARYILANPGEYSAAILGKDPDAYAAWIQQDSSWGGYVELAVLSVVLGVQIVAVTVDSGHVQRYNEEAGEVIVIVYSGIHYDAVALSAGEELREADVRVFEGAVAVEVVHATVELCKKLGDMGYMTNTATFSILCNVCGWRGKGEREVARHAEESGHYDFGET